MVEITGSILTVVTFCNYMFLLSCSKTCDANTAINGNSGCFVKQNSTVWLFAFFVLFCKAFSATCGISSLHSVLHNRVYYTSKKFRHRLDLLYSNMVNSNFHLIQIFGQIFATILSFYV